MRCCLSIFRKYTVPSLVCQVKRTVATKAPLFFPSIVYGVGTSYIDSVSNPTKAKQLAFALRVSSLTRQRRKVESATLTVCCKFTTLFKLDLIVGCYFFRLLVQTKNLTKKEKDKGGFSHFQKYPIFGVTKPSCFIHCTKTQPLPRDDLHLKKLHLQHTN